MSDWPTMDDYRAGAQERAQRRLAAKSPQERVVYLDSMRLIRQGAVFSGIQEWTPAHTIGALFTASSIKSSLQELHRARVIDHQSMEVLIGLVEIQEDIVIHLDAGT